MQSVNHEVIAPYATMLLPQEAIEQQQAAFEALLQRLGRASSEEIQQVLADREPAAPEPSLDPALVARLRRQISAAQAVA